MGGIFSKKRTTSPKPAPVSDHDNAILQLKTQRDKIKQLIRRKEKYLEKERQLAKQLIGQGRKDRALLLLKKKRFEENSIAQIQGQLDKIERMVSDLEFAEVQQRVVEGLRQGNEALKKINAMFDVEEIDRIMDETKEGAEFQQEISDMLSGQLTQTDIADAERELEELLAGEEGRETQLPEAPTHDLPKKEQEERETERPAKEKKQRVALEAQ
ncbi:hypothetical protein WR25_09874 isoform A [Diploscapter pachys]|uniref:Charged multivesicular body protein 6 n=1 Tax=Diploscapter pachys TaxID=2018661 RepID=A0A2A2LHH9_9BILA|nr:hypothetical protein WR25_09874 isoform A [Diploscapter pachys]